MLSSSPIFFFRSFVFYVFASVLYIRNINFFFLFCLFHIVYIQCCWCLASVATHYTNIALNAMFSTRNPFCFFCCCCHSCHFQGEIGSVYFFDFNEAQQNWNTRRILAIFPCSAVSHCHFLSAIFPFSRMQKQIKKHYKMMEKRKWNEKSPFIQFVGKRVQLEHTLTDFVCCFRFFPSYFSFSFLFRTVSRFAIDT